MALSSANALKAKIESLGLSLSAYRDAPPPEQALPYVTIHEWITVTTDESGDNGANPTGRELAQVDLWQQHLDPDTETLVESYTLASDLARGLHGAQLANVGDKRIYGCRVRDAVRLLEPNDEGGLVHHALTVELSRVL